MYYRKQSKIIHQPSKARLNMSIIDQSIHDFSHTDKRIVVRGIAIKNNQILVVYPKHEEIYGTPGGGIEAGESLIEALKREMLEEVGATELDILEYIGVMKTYRLQAHSDMVFNPIHHLFLVDIKTYGKPKLENYEIELGLKHKFMQIDDVLAANEKALFNRKQSHLDFYTNQTFLLEKIKDLYHL